MKSKRVRVITRGISVINVDDLVRIDYGNILGEVLTIDPVLADIGVLRADSDYISNKLSLGLEVYSAKFRKKYRDDNTREEYNSARKLVLKQPTSGEIDDALRSDERYIRLKRKVDEAKHNADVVSEVYWALKSKSDKLSRFGSIMNIDGYDDETIVNAIKAKGGIISDKLHN